MDKPRLTVEESRRIVASLARMMDTCAIHKRWLFGDASAGQVEAEATIYAEAIRVILRWAGLSESWQENLDEPDGGLPNNAEH